MERPMMPHPEDSDATVTRAEIVRTLVQRLNVPKQDGDVYLNTFLNTILDSLHEGKTIELRGFGSFGLRTRKPRLGRNPRSGEVIEVPAKRVAFFKPGKELRDALGSQTPDSTR